MTIFCYDTEFFEDGRTIDLISIGIVCEDGREYYAINSDANWDQIRKDDWLMDNVVRHLPTHSTGQVKKRSGFGETGWHWGGLNMRDCRVKPKWVIANEVRDFIVGDIAARDEEIADDELPELWAYYGAYDHVALCQLWGRMINHPRFMPMWTHDLMQLIEHLGPDFQKPPQTNEHDALADARWNYELLVKAGDFGRSVGTPRRVDPDPYDLPHKELLDEDEAAREQAIYEDLEDVLDKHMVSLDDLPDGWAIDAAGEILQATIRNRGWSPGAGE